MFSEDIAAFAHPVGCDSALQIVMVIWRIFFEFELAGLGVEARCWLKKCSEQPLLSAEDCHTWSDHLAE
jgi:hypothetical protein